MKIKLSMYEFQKQKQEAPFVPDNEIPFPIHGNKFIQLRANSTFHKKNIEIITCGGILPLKLITLCFLAGQILNIQSDFFRYANGREINIKRYKFVAL